MLFSRHLWLFRLVVFLRSLRRSCDDDNDYDEENDDTDDDLHFHILPKVFLLDPDCGLVELLGALVQFVGALLQMAQLSLALQHLLNIAAK